MGDVGPAGPAGADGSDGTAGAAGAAGADGAAGAAGADGMDGVDATVPDPVDTSFSFAVTNNSGGTHRGMDVLTLDFDGAAASGTTVVSTRVTQPPRIDGRDGGETAEWGGFGSDVTFDAGTAANGITGATLRSVYNDQYIYFFAQWTETTGDGATVGASTTRRQYAYDGSVWSRTGNEDRAFFAFPIDDAAFATGGCTSACHGTTMAAPTDAIWDVWHWKASRTGPTHTVDDKWWDDGTFAGTPNNGRNSDEGMSAYWEPGSGTAPAWMPADIVAGAGAYDYPVWVWEVVPFDSSLSWASGDSFPGVINRIPTGSRGDTTAVARFDTDTWTLEIKRARWTGSGDDVQF